MATHAPSLFYGAAVKTYPVLSAGTTATAGAANTYGAYVQLDDGTNVTADSRLASVCIRTPSAAMTGKVELVYDEAGSPVSLAEVDFEVATDAGGLLNISLVGMGPVIPSGETLGARIKTTAGAQTVTLSVGIMDAV